MKTGKKKKQGGNRGGSRFFRWIRSDLPDEEDTKTPVLLLGVTKISDSPALSRRRLSETSHNSGAAGSGRFFRPPQSKYSRGLHGDERLEKIRLDLLTHKHYHRHIPDLHSDYPRDGSKERDDSKRRSKRVSCLALNCVDTCNCERDRSTKSSNRGSFLFHRPDQRQSSLCPSIPYEPSSTYSTSVQDYTEQDIEHRFTEHTTSCHGDSDQGVFTNPPRKSNTQSYYCVTPKSTERRSLLLSNLNERFRKTLSLDSRKNDTNGAPLSLPQSRPKSMVQASVSPKSYRSEDTFLEPQESTDQSKKKRFRPKSFFSLETFFDTKRSDSSSVDDYSSSKYKRFELEGDESPVLRDRLDLNSRRQVPEKERTPDLLDLPFIIDSVKKKGRRSETQKQLDKLESHFYRNLGRVVVDAVPKDATEPSIAHSSNTHNYIFDDDEVEYIEPIRSNFTSQSTLIIDSKVNILCEESHTPVKAASVLSINTEDTDIRIPSSDPTISPRSEFCARLEHDIDSIGPYEIEVKESDLMSNRAKDLIVKIMVKSVDSIGSCSLDVDASTDFSDTTSGSLNLLTPSSTTSRIRDFTSRLQERAASASVPAGSRHLAQASPHPPPRAHGDAASHRSRSHKKPDHKKPSYLNLACSVNGYSNLTTYDSKLRQNISKSREASPIRPITRTYYRAEANQALLVPVPVSADRLIVPIFQPHDTKQRTHLTERAPAKAHTDPYLATSPIPVYMAAENQQLKSDFLGKTMAVAASASSYSESQKFADSMLHQSKTNDEVDNVNSAKELTFKSSYSETNITSKKVSSTTVNGQKTESRFTSAESYTIHSTNGVTSRVEITKENGEELTSPMKSFIQQRVERLYGPGALAQGFFNQRRHKNKSHNEAEETISEANKVLTEKSLNCQVGERLFVYPSRCARDTARNIENVDRTSSNGDPKSPGLPVLRHLRPEFRAQLPVISPKKSPGRTEINTTVNGAVPRLNLESAEKTTAAPEANGHETNGCLEASAAVSDVAADLSRVKVEEVTNGEGSGAEARVNGSASEARDAHYFLDLEKRETERLIQLAVSAERHLESLQGGAASEEVLGLLRSAAGKARLLATQKMQQFEGLCYNNINRRDGEQFPTTLQDLQGFWDMVCLQVRQVDTLYRQIEEMRANGWREVTVVPPAGAGAGGARTPRTPAARAPRTAAASPAAAHTSERARLAAERREGERKAMIEQRRRMAREKQLANRTCVAGTSREDQHEMGIEGGQEVEIFIGGVGKKIAPQGDQATPARSEQSVRAS